MRTILSILMALVAGAVMAQRVPLYHTNTLRFLQTNLLSSNILSGANITVSNNANGTVTIYGSAGAAATGFITNMGGLGTNLSLYASASNTIPLSVSGPANSQTNLVRVDTSGGTQAAFMVSSNGNVGIGTNQASATLTVQGGGYFTGSLTNASQFRAAAGAASGPSYGFVGANSGAFLQGDNSMSIANNGTSVINFGGAGLHMLPYYKIIWSTNFNPQAANASDTYIRADTTNGMVHFSKAITATNGVFGASGCLVYGGTGELTNSTTAVETQITGWNYTNTFGGVVQGSGGFTNPVAGNYSISWGTGVLAGNGDQSTIYLKTNAVKVNVLELVATMPGALANWETGFKELILPLPANTHITLWTSNNAANPLRLRNACFNLKGAN